MKCSTVMFVSGHRVCTSDVHHFWLGCSYNDISGEKWSSAERGKQKIKWFSMETGSSKNTPSQRGIRQQRQPCYRSLHQKLINHFHCSVLFHLIEVFRSWFLEDFSTFKVFFKIFRCSFREIVKFLHNYSFFPIGDRFLLKFIEETRCYKEKSERDVSLLEHYVS